MISFEGSNPLLPSLQCLLCRLSKDVADPFSLFSPLSTTSDFQSSTYSTHWLNPVLGKQTYWVTWVTWFNLHNTFYLNVCRIQISKAKKTKQNKTIFLTYIYTHMYVYTLTIYTHMWVPCADPDNAVTVTTPPLCNNRCIVHSFQCCAFISHTHLFLPWKLRSSCTARGNYPRSSAPLHNHCTHWSVTGKDLCLLQLSTHSAKHADSDWTGLAAWISAQTAGKTLSARRWQLLHTLIFSSITAEQHV